MIDWLLQDTEVLGEVDEGADLTGETNKTFRIIYHWRQLVCFKKVILPLIFNLDFLPSIFIHIMWLRFFSNFNLDFFSFLQFGYFFSFLQFGYFFSFLQFGFFFSFLQFGFFFSFLQFGFFLLSQLWISLPIGNFSWN